jgi:hypothetical protein
MLAENLRLREVLAMRFLMKVSMETEASNKSVIDGTLGEKLNRIMGELKPEVAYFTTEAGKRTGFIFLDMPEAYMMPKLAEPFFLAFDAGVDWYPVMSPEDLAKAGPDLERVAKEYGR